MWTAVYGLKQSVGARCEYKLDCSEELYCVTTKKCFFWFQIVVVCTLRSWLPCLPEYLSISFGADPYDHLKFEDDEDDVYVERILQVVFLDPNKASSVSTFQLYFSAL